MAESRVAQEAVQVVTRPGERSARVAQEAVQVVARPGERNLRVAQQAVQVVTAAPVRVTSMVREVLFRRPRQPRWPDTAAPGTPIKASQVAGLRDAISQRHQAAYGQDYAWTWPNVAAGDRILAKHFTEMRAAIQHLWDFKGRGSLPMWSSGVTPGGPSVGTAATRILAGDVTDLRSWLELYENNHPPYAQGILAMSHLTNGLRCGKK